MKKIHSFIIIVLVAFSFNCCGIKESAEENSKWKSDLQARLIMKDSVITMYKDSLQWCREDNVIVK
ncbi:MAG: hypothetical protein IMZ53_12850 [Thermoplasmata archaeon]|nr:hypothetical protein [Thermoplasmata archaeon]